MAKAFDVNLFQSVPIIGILRNIPKNRIDTILPLFGTEGLGTVEITMNSPNAFELIRHCADVYGSDLNIGAGTVCDINDLEKALSAGATFIVTPNFDESVVRRCKKLNIPVFVGAMTPSEVYQAWNAGATMIKLFPADLLGPRYLSALKAPLSQVRFLATGGINLSNMEDFWRAGARGFGVGTPLFPAHLLKANDKNDLQNHLNGFVEKIKLLIKSA